MQRTRVHAPQMQPTRIKIRVMLLRDPGRSRCAARAALSQGRCLQAADAVQVDLRHGNPERPNSEWVLTEATT